MAHQNSRELDSVPEEYSYLNELAAPVPIQRSCSERSDHKESEESLHKVETENHNIPDEFLNLDELAATSPIQNPHERQTYHEDFLEDRRSHEQSDRRNADRWQDESGLPNGVEESQSNAPTPRPSSPSKLIIELYAVSYLILFAILGTLARLGLQTLTAYPGSPVTRSELWANVGGSVVMGFLSEDRTLFKNHTRFANTEAETEEREDSDASQETEITNNRDPEKGRMETQKAHNAMKKTIPLYIGLATGFCGSFTSFSSFIRDVLLELANQPFSGLMVPRNGGDSFMAILAVIILTVGLCLSALKAGAHLAIGIEKFMPPLPVFIVSNTFNRCLVVLSWGLWLGSIFLAVWTPDQSWRGQVLFAIVFAPLGCIVRFYVSLRLNGIAASFPLGTFVVNMCGTVILGMCWDLQRVSLGATRGRAETGIGGGILGCQVLQGVQDGFCGCLTTVSTWVLELMSLRRKHAYIYGGFSISVALAFLVAIMGSLVWSRGVSPLACSV